MEIYIPTTERLRTVGRCIYCGRDGDKERLSDEHVIPYSFGGHRVLVQASCAECSAITSALEGRCCEMMFKALRVHHGLPSRTKHRGKSLPILAGPHPGCAPKVDVSPNKAPGVVVMPVFAAPRMLLELRHQRADLWQNAMVWPTTSDAVERQKALIAEGMPGALASVTIPIGEFLRVLAKIAHAYLISQDTEYRYCPLLPDIILGRDTSPERLVGGIADIPIAIKTNGKEIHKVVPQVLEILQRKYLTVQIRLFAHLPEVPPPVYFVVAGEERAPCPQSAAGCSRVKANAN